MREVRLPASQLLSRLESSILKQNARGKATVSRPWRQLRRGPERVRALPARAPVGAMAGSINVLPCQPHDCLRFDGFRPSPSRRESPFVVPHRNSPRVRESSGETVPLPWLPATKAHGPPTSAHGLVLPGWPSADDCDRGQPVVPNFFDTHGMLGYPTAMPVALDAVRTSGSSAGARVGSRHCCRPCWRAK